MFNGNKKTRFVISMSVLVLVVLASSWSCGADFVYGGPLECDKECRDYIKDGETKESMLKFDRCLEACHEKQRAAAKRK